MSLLLQNIKYLYDNKIITKISRENICDNYDIGIIKKYNDDFIIFNAINENGFFDGYNIIFVNDITYMKWDDNETKSLKKILRNHIEFIHESIDIKNFNSILEYFYNNKIPISLYNESSDEDGFFLGIIIEIDDKYIYLDSYGNKNTLDKSKVILIIGNITKIEFDNEYNNSIMKVYL